MVFKKTAVPSFTVTRMKMCIDLPNLTPPPKKIAQHNKTTSPLMFELKCAFLRSSLLQSEPFKLAETLLTFGH